MQKTGMIWGLLVVLCGLSACDSSQKASHSELSHSKSSTQAVSASQVSVTVKDPDSVQTTQSKPVPAKAEASVTSVSTVGSDDTAAKSLCDTVNVNSWMGFDESLETPECKILKGYQLTSYKCEVSSSAFGLHIDAALIENGEQRIFTYPSKAQCLEALDTRDANAP